MSSLGVFAHNLRSTLSGEGAIDGSTTVLDVGKTHAKLSLWDEQGGLVDHRVRANATGVKRGWRALDVDGIDAWLLAALAEFARQRPIRRIVPVAHGAAAALIRKGRLFAPPMDYEEPIPDAERRAYAAGRDPFALSGSPFLPGALNLGLQLHHIESVEGRLPADVAILPWPQFWAWRLCGEPASELTSLGCHTDLWRPVEGRFSDLAIRRGWAERFAPIRAAGETLGTITPAVAAATGLPPGCEVVCGLHDSNAALVASRAHAAIAEGEATVLSTGTWFVAMRLLAADAAFDTRTLPAQRDCLLNVDVAGRPVPSARFMGGRESERIRGGVAESKSPDLESLLERLPRLVASGARAYPSFVAGSGPYPSSAGRLVELSTDARDRQIVADLYLACMAATLLDLLGSSARLLIEGRFAGEALFTRALATIRPEMSLFVSAAGDDLANGALRLVAPALQAPSALARVEPLAIEIDAFAEDFRRQARIAPPPSNRSRLELQTSAEI